jgi:S1-C subfamily serine protease
MVKWNGDAISDFNKYIAIVENTRLGSKARIEVLRRGRPVIVEAIIEARRRPQP